jgi:integrase
VTSWLFRALKWGDVDWTRATFRIRAGRYRGVESTPKTIGGIRDVDMLPRVVEALKTQKAQQAAARLKLGLGAPGQAETMSSQGRRAAC